VNKANVEGSGCGGCHGGVSRKGWGAETKCL
jgi:hypothetical protein